MVEYQLFYHLQALALKIHKVGQNNFCSTPWVYGRWMMFFNNGIHEKLTPNHPLGFVHLILCATILCHWELPIWRDNHVVKEHKGLTFCGLLKANDMLVNL